MTKSATARYAGTGLRFTARSGSGHEVVLDNKEGDAGPRPMEMVLLGQAGCTAMDVLSILAKKRQDVTAYEVRSTPRSTKATPPTTPGSTSSITSKDPPSTKPRSNAR